MGKFLLRDVVVEVNGVNLSDHGSSVTVNSEADLHETTAFGASYKSNLLGLGDGSFEVTLQQDFDAGSVDATLWSLHSGKTVFPVVLRPTSGPIGPTNPAYRMIEAVLPTYNPLSGDVGELSTTDVTFQNAGQAGIERLVA